VEPPRSRAPQLRAGDRVQLIVAQPGIAVGAIGTVVSRFVSSFSYDVQFDGHSIPRVIDGRYLAPAPAEPAQPP
jgi:hypothetical protein